MNESNIHIANEVLNCLDKLCKSIKRHRDYYHKQSLSEPIKLDITTIEHNERCLRIVWLPSIFNIRSYLTVGNTMFISKYKFSDALDEKTVGYLFEDYCKQGFPIYNIIITSQDIDYITELDKATNGMLCKFMKIIYMNINNIEWLDNKPDFIKFLEQASKTVYLSLSR